MIFHYHFLSDPIAAAKKWTNVLLLLIRSSIIQSCKRGICHRFINCSFLTQNNFKWLTDSDQKVDEHLKLPHWCDGPIWIKPQKEVVLRHPVASYVVMIITSWRIVEPTGSRLHNTFFGIYMFDSYAAVLLH